ncbi:MAG: anaerobic ribonucleoside-triphosphate reductase activating protein [Eubacteriales bacterium]|nr:anaerobic ribonucleoside-triphosphate reductase activating protein [Eubacteriales bacterium]
MNIRLFGLADDSIVDGPGLRFAVFTQGCYHNCEGCHNPNSHDVNGGYDEDTDVIIEKIKANPLLDGVTLSGGEPFLQAKPLTLIADAAKESGLNVMAYTGYTFEELIKGANEDNGWLELLGKLDLLVDGKFVLAERSIELNFKGSRNQRILNVPESLKVGKAVLSEIDK